MAMNQYNPLTQSPMLGNLAILGVFGQAEPRARRGLFTSRTHGYMPHPNAFRSRTKRKKRKPSHFANRGRR